MGFAPVAATAILLLTALFAAGIYVQDWHASEQARQTAERQALALRTDRLHSDMSVVSTAYQNGPDRFTITVENTGSVVLRASELDWVLDGVWSNGLIESQTVDGDPTGDVWVPGTQLVMEFRPVDPPPGRVVLTAGNGAQLVEAV